MLDELLSDDITIISLVHNGMGQRLLRRYLRKHGRKDRAFMPVPCRQDDRNAGAFIATARMDFGGQAAPRAAQSLCGLPAVFFSTVR